MNIIENPLISIVVITYNSSKYVLDTLKSVRNQDYPNIELIISDDCSTDNTFEIISEWLEKNKEYFVRTLAVQTEKNGGICINYNRGLQEVQGEWVKYIAGDDILLPNCISTFAKELKNRNEKIMICGTMHFCLNKTLNKHLLPQIFKEFSAREQEMFIVKKGTVIEGPTLFLEVETLRNIGGFEECYPFIEDYPLYMKYLSKGYHIHVVDDYLIRYRVYQESVSRSNSKFTTSIYSAIDHYAPKAALRNGMFLWWYHHKANAIIRRLPKRYKWFGYLLRTIDFIYYKDNINSKW